MDPIDPERRRAHLRSGLLLLGTFLAGGLAGAGVYRATATAPRPVLTRGVPPWLAEVGLSAAQLSQIDEIVDRHRPALDAVLHEVVPKLAAERESVETEVRALLSPDQQRQFDLLKSRSGPPRGPGMGLRPGPH